MSYYVIVISDAVITWNLYYRNTCIQVSLATIITLIQSSLHTVISVLCHIVLFVYYIM